MQEAFFHTPLESMPSVIPIMPYNDAILMPYGKLSLRLKEKRHFNMIFDALATGRIVGTVQSMEPVFEFSPILYSVGCAGKITAFSESEDGDSLAVTLTGVSRFKIIEELKRPRGYRMAKVNYSNFIADLMLAPNKIDRKAFFPLIESFLKENKLDITKKMLCNMHDAKMLSVLAMFLPLEARERQAMLEAETLEKLQDVMESIVKMNKSFKNKS